MKNKNDNKNFSDHQVSKEEKEVSGYPLYPENDDIYSKGIEEKDINPEDISETKQSNKNARKNFNEDISGGDLDVPGSELDDEQENIGNEDEENNYYSLGSDDHNDLDEDNGA